MASRGWMALHAALALATASFAAGTASALDCKTDTDCAGTPRTPKCLLPYGICGCSDDSQCGNATSGLICTGTSPEIGQPPFCTSGCGNAAGRNGCASDERCTAPSGGTGQCFVQCTAGLSLCLNRPVLNQCALLNGLQNQCVECQTSDDCRSKPETPVCNTNNDRCVECTADAQCAGKTNGTLCRLPDDACGCNADTDCVAGRICNTTIHACLPGCRIADGGGSCPPGDRCISTDGGSDGQCVPIVDAGGGDSGGGNGDSGADSGTPDGGGSGDSGAPDSGSGSGDGGSIADSGSDSGNVDSGGGDGSVADSGNVDSGGGDGSVADGSSPGDGGNNGNDGGGNGNDAGNGNDGGNENGNNGNYDTSLEGGGCDCTISPSAEDSLPIAGLIAVGGFLAIVTRRRKKSA